MAERRMFAKTIIDSDAFLDMPQSTQLLYFHLAMRADDDGFINNPRAIMRNVGCKDDDLKVLSAKKFVLHFDNGVIVIKHWRIHNYIAKDRYHETKYKDEKSRLSLDENGSYTQCIQTVDNLDTDCIQPVDELSTQVRLGEDSLGDNIAPLADSAQPPEPVPAQPSAVAVVKKQTDPLYQAIWQSFITKTPTMANYAAQGKATHRLVEFIRKHADQEDPESAPELARQLVTKYWELTQGRDRFWMTQPFTPMNLSSSGILDRVLLEMQKKKQEVDYDSIPF